MHYRLLAALILGLFLAACGGQLGVDSGVDGVWDGVLTEIGEPLTLELTQTGTNLSGTLTTSGETVPMTGTAAGNLISLSYQTAKNTLRIEASVDGDAMQGTLAVTSLGETVASGFTASR